jgi:hypothetical protein
LTVTIFGSGTVPEGSAEFQQAERLGRLLGESGFTVCNGGYGGTMLAAARGARQAHATTIGVTLSKGPWPKANPWIVREVACQGLPERIIKLLEAGDAYVVLAGGTGTLAEIGLMLELLNKGFLPPRPVVFLGPFWSPLLRLLASEPVLAGQPAYRPVEGITLTGNVAGARSAETAVEFLRENLSPCRTA